MIVIATAEPASACEGPAIAITRASIRASHTADVWGFLRWRKFAFTNEKSLRNIRKERWRFQEQTLGKARSNVAEAFAIARTTSRVWEFLQWRVWALAIVLS